MYHSQIEQHTSDLEFELCEKWGL